MSPPFAAAPATRGATVRIAAVGDLHVKADGSALLTEIPDLRGSADLLLIAGDLTDNGRIVEAEAAAEMLAAARIPTFAVLGNHDLRTLRRTALRRVFDRAGVGLIDGAAEHLTTAAGVRVGIAATTGSGGGFWPVEGPDAIHARTLKRLAVRSRRESLALDQALANLDADYRIALLHFSPTVSTLGREPLAKYWMLGNCELGKVVDLHRPDLVIHGHAHLGNLNGHTLSGVEVRNVAASITHGVHVETLGGEGAELPVMSSRARRV
ncbi:MAG: metallophosphoesterase [Thermomicrobiales bacterium]